MDWGKGLDRAEELLLEMNLGGGGQNGGNDTVVAESGTASPARLPRKRKSLDPRHPDHTYLPIYLPLGNLGKQGFEIGSERGNQNEVGRLIASYLFPLCNLVVAMRTLVSRRAG